MFRTVAVSKNVRGVLGFFVVLIGALLVAGYLGVGGALASPGHATLIVPFQYPTIQSAINAAHSGDTILVAPGTYVEQLTITTSVNIIGSGPGKTIIQCPTTAPASGATISITNGATVTLSGFTIFADPNGDGQAVWITGSTAAISGNSIQASSPNAVGIYMDSSSARITSNVIVATANPIDGDEIGILAAGSQATILHNLIQGPGAFGIYLVSSSGTIEYNVVSQFGCSYNPPLLAAGLCGPSYADQFQSPGIGDVADAGLGTTIAYNVVSTTDVGVFLADGCPGCVVKGNILVNSFDYGLFGGDGTYTFLQNTVIGGAYGVGAAAAFVVTTVTLCHVSIVAPSVAPFYLEQDYGQPLPTIGGTWTVVG